jgi:hypothetical protein
VLDCLFVLIRPNSGGFTNEQKISNQNKDIEIFFYRLNLSLYRVSHDFTWSTNGQRIAPNAVAFFIKTSQLTLTFQLIARLAENANNCIHRIDVVVDGLGRRENIVDFLGVLVGIKRAVFFCPKKDQD